MASGPQQQQQQQQQQQHHHHHHHHHQQQQQQQQQHHHQQQQEHLMQQQNHQMQYVTSHTTGLNTIDFNIQQQQQQQPLHHNTISPTPPSMSMNHNQRQMVSVNPHQHHHQPQSQQHRQQHQHQQSLMGPVVGSALMSQVPSDQSTEQSENDHEQIIDQVISLENEFSDTSNILSRVVDTDTSGLLLGNQVQHQQQQLQMSDNNQFSNSSEDLLNLLLQFEPESSNLIGLSNNQQLNQDEQIGIENIRKQLMSCEVQSEQNPSCTPQQQQQQQQQQQHPQQQQHQMSNDQTLLPGSYSNIPMSNVPISSPSTTEPSIVVKKNPLLNAQLVNSRPTSITPTRFMNSQPNVLNQNPILNAKLSQSNFVSNSGSNNRLVQQTNFSFDITQQHTPPQGHMNLYRPSSVVNSNDGGSITMGNISPSTSVASTTIASTSPVGGGVLGQQTNFNFDITQQHTTPRQGHVNLCRPNIYGQTSVLNPGAGAGGGGGSLNMGNTSPSGACLSQQVKQEIRRKVQQPKQQHQTTSLLKQLLSDDSK